MSTEIEARFLEVDTKDLISQLEKLGAQDKGEAYFKEAILQDHQRNWFDDQRRVRVRDTGEKIELAYKEGSGEGMHMIEYEINVSDYEETIRLMLACDLSISRRQEKYRHSFVLNECKIDIDTWPGIPPYVEIEGPNVASIQVCATQLGFDWEKRYEKDAMWLIKENYGLELNKITEFTFDNLQQITANMK